MDNIDIERVKKSIEILKPNNALYEIRILIGSGKRKQTISGFFKGTENLEAAFNKIDLRRANVFYTLNEIAEGCYSREQHERFLQIDDTTSDSDITAYRWFLVDIDPKRNSGISSTNEELEAAKTSSGRVKEYLANMGFSKPIEALSGNGCHLLYAIDLPNNDENEKLIKQCLYALDAIFTNDQVDIDRSVYNPSRVSKLYGSIARKGADTEERPHRMSQIVKVPGKIRTTERACFERLAATLPAEEKPARIQKRSSEFNVETWLSEHGIGVNKVNTTPDGAVKYVLDECPFNNSHRAPDSMVIVQPSGAIGFRCLHKSCIDKSWQDLRLKFEPDAYDQTESDARIESGWKVHKQYIITKQTDNVEEIKKNMPAWKYISSYDLQHKEFPETYFAVEGMIPEGETVIAAPPKTGKSWLMLDMCLKVAKGEKFLGFETHKSDTLYLALEDGEKFEQERLNMVTQDAPKNFHFVFNDVLHLSEGFLFQLDAFIEKFPQTKLVVIDTLNYIQHHQAKGESAYNCDYRTGKDLKAYAEEKEIAIVVVTHTTKMIHAEDEMMNVSGTNGVTGAADAVVVLSKERRTDLDAKMFITGRKVRQSMHEIKFNDKECRWEYKGVAEVGDKDQREREDKEQEYFDSQIRNVVLNIANTCVEPWSGRAGAILEKALDFKIGLVESNKQVGGFMSKMQGMFMAYDGIKVEKIKNGNAPYIWKIYPPIDLDEVNDGFIQMGEG
jgi:hypothetical protein